MVPGQDSRRENRQQKQALSTTLRNHRTEKKTVTPNVASERSHIDQVGRITNSPKGEKKAPR